MKPTVSVVIATYNGAAFIAETIDSILGQGYEHLDLVVVDDGSSDGTPEVVEGYADRLTFIRQENAGVSAARNRGAAASRGELIAFIDQDDAWEPDLLATLLPLLAAHPHWGLVYSDSWIVDSDGVRRGRRESYLDYEQGWIFPSLLSGNFIPIETTVMRKSLFDKVGGFDESLRYLEDYEINLRVARECPIGFHDGPLARYRIHGNNLSHNIEAILREWARVLEELRDRVPDLTSAERQIIDREIHLRYGELAWQAIRRGDLPGADEWLRQAGPECAAGLRWKVRLPRMVLGVLPDPVSERLVRMLPKRKLYGISPLP